MATGTGSGAGGCNGAGDETGDLSICCPHCSQNTTPSGSGLPQDSQNFCAPEVIDVPDDYRRPYAVKDLFFSLAEFNANMRETHRCRNAPHFMKAQLTLILLILSFIPLRAGQQVEFRCENPKCKFRETCSNGGGFAFEQLSGYCMGFKKFVSITWKRNQSPPAGVTSVWVPKDPRMKGAKNLFPCPVCKNPVYAFMINSDPKKKLQCPGCYNDSLTTRVLVNYD